MRALEVLGLAGDGTSIVCQDAASGEEFAVPADERLRAALRGDLSRLGQLEIEMEPQLRPREIQARIRAGASVAEVAKAAGTSVHRIETFAHPVLMERSAIAERAAACMVDGAAQSTPVRDVVATRLEHLGQTGSRPTAVRWDARRTGGSWVLTAHWSIGRNENVAEFDWHPVAGGGTVIPRNEVAADLVRPERSPLRGLPHRPPAPRPAPPGALDETMPLPQLDATGEIVTRTTRPLGGTPARSETTPAEVPAAFRRRPSAPVERPAVVAVRPAAPVLPAEVVVPAQRAEPAASGEPGRPDAVDETVSAEELVAATVEDERSGAHPVDRESRAEQVARTGTDHATGDARPGKARRAAKPAMPSWDDVLLGGTRRR